jgi:uroporphyrinogen decarboxylase
VPARQKLEAYYGTTDLDAVLGNHLAKYRTRLPDEPIEGRPGFWRGEFGIVFNRTVDKDIGVVEGLVIPEPTLANYKFPDPLDARWFSDVPGTIQRNPDLYRVFSIGFSLYERAWTLRGMENLLMDFHENPEFAHELLRAIADWDIAQVKKAVTYDIDAVYFGDDWGSQHGLQMGPGLWREFIKPELARMYGAVKSAGKRVWIHSCGDVDELFDDLVSIGLDCFNPFQPEVMDCHALMQKYRGKLSFHGGLSTQRVLPYGTPDDVRRATRDLLEWGRDGGYIFAPAHAVPKDAPADNMIAFIETVTSQPGAR